MKKITLMTLLASTLIVGCASEPKPYVFSDEVEVGRYAGSEQLEQKKEVALAVSKAILQGDWKKLDHLLSDDFRYDGDRMHFNKDEYIGFMQDLYLAMKDMDMKFKQVYAEGEFVTVRFENPMLNVGSFMGAPATGKKIVAEGIFIRQVRDGKVIKENQTTDILGIMTQMGFGALFGYTMAIGLFEVEPDRPVRKSIAEMDRLLAERDK